MQLAGLFKIINVNNHNLFFIKAILALGVLCLSGPVSAGQWKPLCVEGSSCSSLYQVHLGGGFGFVSDVNSTELPDGRNLPSGWRKLLPGMNLRTVLKLQIGVAKVP